MTSEAIPVAERKYPCRGRTSIVSSDNTAARGTVNIHTLESARSDNEPIDAMLKTRC